MITVACPNCSFENSALSRRCTSCGTELVIEGYVRCDNCMVLTPAALEFCELCGSYLAAAAPFDKPLILPSSRQDADAADTSPLKLPSNLSTGNFPDAQKRGEERSLSERQDQPESNIPGWLLDVDAALKMRSITEKEADETDSSSATKSPESKKAEPQKTDVYDELLRRLDASHAVIQPSGPEESEDWLTDMKVDDVQSEQGNIEDLAFRALAAVTLASPQSPGDEGEVDQPEDQPPGQPLAEERTDRRQSGSTQPLDPKGKLLGVPKQLAATELPAWLNDQLHRSEEDEEEFIDDIELPAPSRATFLEPVTPDAGQDEPDDEVIVLDASFDKWLKQLSDEPATPDWMSEGEGSEEGPFESDFVQMGAETPQWLHDIHEAEGDTALLLGIEEIVEETGRFAGIKGAIQIEPAIAASLIGARMFDYSISKEQEQKVAILESIVHAKPVKQKPKAVELPRDSSLRMRVLLALALLLVILFVTVVPSSAQWLQDSTLQPATEQTRQFYDELMLAAGEPVLVAFEYTPAMAGELNPIANAVLGQLADNDSPVITVSQSAAGSEVAAIIAEEIEGLALQQLGYIPGEAVGLRSLAECISESDKCETLFGEEIPAELQESLSAVSLVVILSSDSDSLIDWIEQVGAQVKDSTLIAGLAQLLGPVALPYSASGQLKGTISGYPDAIYFQQDLLGIENEVTERASGLTIAIWLAAGFLIAGAVYYAITGLNRSRSGKAKDS
jgi:hypothetical protein